MVCRWGRKIGAKLTAEKSRNGFGAELRVERWTSPFGCGEDMKFSPNARAVPMQGRSISWGKKESRVAMQILFAGKVEEEVDDSENGLLGVFP